MTRRMFQSLLIANRGEIACRIIRTARAQGLRCIAVYSDADAGAPHVRLADQAVRIGPGPSAQSYLSIPSILAAAKEAGAEAIHPGYGFLSENTDFARAVVDAGLVFIGPPPEAIEAMGDKAAAKRAMIAAGVPCVPGYEDADQSDATLIAAAARIGYPIMVKASAGGGGRGMRFVANAEALPDALASARDEARNAFGSDTLILERAIVRPRHVEIQIFADSHGHCLHLGERDCSVQRRHQKVLEEVPCPVLTSVQRDAMGAAAIAAALAVGYVGAGTVEFLLDASGAFYFLEMNTRLQVEHPVTEMVTGLDLVALQFSVARGEALPFSQADVRLSGHAIEARLYAEDPAADFLPATGRIDLWHAADGEGVRIESGVTSGQTIPPFYDAMFAKVIAWGETREIARARLIAALKGTAAFGPPTNADFLIALLSQPAFVMGEATTALIAEAYPQGFPAAPLRTEALAVAVALLLRCAAEAAQHASLLPDTALIGFASAAPLATPVDLRFGEAIHRLSATPLGHDGWRVSEATWHHLVRVEAANGPEVIVTIDGRRQTVLANVTTTGIALVFGAERFSLTRHCPWLTPTTTAGSGRISAPMPGLVVSVAVEVGAQVAKGQCLAVLEAMKMQHQICAEVTGRLNVCRVEPGQQLTAGAPMFEIEEAAECTAEPTEMAILANVSVREHPDG
jgi:geranyl-CoA carboxylase alpha subunit